VNFAAFQGGVFRRRADNREVVRAELVDNTGDERNFRSDDGEIDVIFPN